MTSSFQTIRGRIEQVTAAALQSAGIPLVTFDNVQENRPPLPWAAVSISFAGTIALSLGCTADKIEGSVIVTVATEKRRGSRAGEDALLAVLRSWASLNADFASPIRLRTRNHFGPVTLPPGTDPHHIHTLNCGFTATVSTAGPPLAGPTLLTTSEGPLVTGDGERILVAL